jgi:hypothetical protein
MEDILLVPDTVDPMLTWSTVLKADVHGNINSPSDDDLSRTGVK